MSKIEFTTEILDQVNAAIAEAKAAAASANSAAANANSAQASTGAAGATVNARTQSNAEQASNTEAIFKTVQQDSDIGVPEAWSANVKRTYDVHQTYDLESQAQMRTHFNTMITQQQNHLSALNQMSLQAIANNQNQSNLNNLLGIDRAWNINETDLAAKSVAVITDAVLSEIAKRGE
jgi:ribosomal protein L14E/L6E/L27E